jgi:hypothetical protein
MNTLSKLTKVKYRDGLWKRQVVEYLLWCDEGTEEICKSLKITRPLLNQWHRWHMKTRKVGQKETSPIYVSNSNDLSPALIAWQKRQLVKNKKLEEKLKADSENVVVLQQQIASLQASLKDEQLRSAALSTMIDIAEQEFKIEIKKKYGAKQSKH